LRRKLEDDPANPKRIITVSGMGYMLTGGDESVEAIPPAPSALPT
jgi:DNA-binding winged helix-turn-helix (wHTH) protein